MHLEPEAGSTGDRAHVARPSPSSAVDAVAQTRLARTKCDIPLDLAWVFANKLAGEELVSIDRAVWCAGNTEDRILGFFNNAHLVGSAPGIGRKDPDVANCFLATKSTRFVTSLALCAVGEGTCALPCRALTCISFI